jgi:hypothetical protein
MKHVISINAITKPFDNFWASRRIGFARQVPADRSLHPETDSTADHDGRQFP